MPFAGAGEAKRINDANQAAILRLMNGVCNRWPKNDLTQEATVTEDITGAIADSVNHGGRAARSGGIGAEHRD